MHGQAFLFELEFSLLDSLFLFGLVFDFVVDASSFIAGGGLEMLAFYLDIDLPVWVIS